MVDRRRHPHLGLICAVQARRHLDGHVRSVELATIGRRVCETEYDLLDLLGATAPVPGPPADAPAVADPGAVGSHGRPTAVELIEAVRTHLADVVAPTLEGAAAFQLKVAGNALRIVERELLAPSTSRLTAADELALAASVRSGATPTADQLAEARAAVVDRLAVANPRWLHLPDQPENENVPPSR